MPSRRHRAASIPVSDPADAPPMASTRTGGSSPSHNGPIAWRSAASAPPSYAPSATAPETVSARRSLTCPKGSARGALRSDLELAERQRLGLVGVRLLGQPEDTLADDVLLDLVAAAVDRDGRGEQRHLLGHAAAGRVGPGEHPVRPEDLQPEVAGQARDSAHEQLRRVGLGAGTTSRRLRRLHAQRGVAADLVEDVQLGEALPHGRVLVATHLLREPLENVRLAARNRALRAVASLPGCEVADAPFELARPLARHRAAEGAAAAAAEAGALVRKRRVGGSPATVQLADHLRLMCARVREEHLAEQRAARHLAERPYLDARLLHVDGEVRDAFVLGCVGIGTGEQHAEIGGLAARRPHLLTVDDPLVAVALRPALEAGEVGPGAGFAEQLAPGFLAVEDRPQVPRTLLVAAVHEDRRPRQEHAEARRRPDRAGGAELFGDDTGEVARKALAEPLLGPGGNAPTGIAQPGPPFGKREIRVPVVGQPPAHLVAHEHVGDHRHDQFPLVLMQSRFIGSVEELEHLLGRARDDGTLSPEDHGPLHELRVLEEQLDHCVARRVVRRGQAQLLEPPVLTDQLRGRRVNGVDDALERGPVRRCSQVLDDIVVDALVGQDVERPAGLATARVVVHEQAFHTRRLPSSRCDDAEPRPEVTMADPPPQFLGRDDVDSVEAILTDDSIDFGELTHPTPARGDAIFTWDYERSRPGLAKLYEKAKTSQWNGATDLDWSTPVDPERVALEMAPAAAMFQQRMADLPDSPVARWGPKEWTQFQVEALNWRMSQFLHGEQGALICTAKIVETTPWIDAKYYAATQVMDEARHVEVFSRYLDTKLDGHYPVNPALQLLIDDIIGDSRWDMTYMGMQIMVEGLALAAFGFMHQVTEEPLLKKLLRYVMADEARHVAFGVLSLQEYYAGLGAADTGEEYEVFDEVAKDRAAG